MTPPTPALTQTSNQEEPDPAQPARPSPGRPAAFLALHPRPPHQPQHCPVDTSATPSASAPTTPCSQAPRSWWPRLSQASAHGLCRAHHTQWQRLLPTCGILIRCACCEPHRWGGGGALLCSQLHPRCLQQCLGPGRCWVSTYGTNN